jgi:hypothetical protein
MERSVANPVLTSTADVSSKMPTLIPPSGMRNSKGRPFGEQALWDLMGGSLLGIVSAGFLLVTQPSTTALLLAAPTGWLSKLEFPV